MDTLGDDLVMLAIGTDGGRVRQADMLKYGVAGSELVRLIANGLVTIEGGRLIAAEPAPAGSSTGDLELDTALASIAGRRRPPTPKSWVARPRRGLVNSYLTKLATAGKIQRSPAGRARWQITDQDALASARARLDAIATSTGPVDLMAAAYGGLAHAANVDRLTYRGWGNRGLRKRMQQVAKGKWTAPATRDADQESHQAISAATQAAVAAAVEAAVHAAAAAAAASSG
ncbi:MAG TPA: GPP34 family phosphoprotein [Streptosporangiaceae bacterium]|nr:GPP34 family phosphoprotein [Streptosporangiaceae bacterium]